MTVFDHVLATLLVVVVPIRSSVAFERLRRAEPARLPALRLASYRNAVLSTAGYAMVVGVAWRLLHRPPADLGLELRIGGGLAGVAAGLAAILAVMLRERRRAVADAEGRAEIRARLDHARPMLPHTRREFAAFSSVAITAGVGEELLFRGYLTWYFSHALPWWAAGLVSAVAFGLGHAYQGVRGVAQTTLVGAFLGAVCVVTGSLYAAMLIHTLMDLHTGDLAWRAYSETGLEHAA